MTGTGEADSAAPKDGGEAAMRSAHGQCTVTIAPSLNAAGGLIVAEGRKLGVTGQGSYHNEFHLLTLRENGLDVDADPIPGMKIIPVFCQTGEIGT